MGYFFIFLFIGLSYFFGDIVLSGWDAIPSSPVDGHATNYFLEHFYLYLKGTPEVHSSLLTLPFFYPMKNTIALADTFISIAPIYVFFRFFTNYAVSYSLTVMTFSVLNFTAMYFILKRLKYSNLLSSFGAFLFTFSYINKVTQMHIQLITHFFYLGSILAMLYVSKHNSKKKNMALFLTASVLYVMQFYTSFYLAFYVYFLIILACILTLFSKRLTKRLKIFILRYKIEIISSICLTGLLILPILILYLQNGLNRDYFVVFNNLPELYQIFTGNTDFVLRFTPNMKNVYNSVELLLMLTYGLFFFGILGLLKFKKYGKLLVAIIIATILIVTKNNIISNFSLWKIVYNLLPGAVGIRETIRIILVLNGLLVVGVINFLSKTTMKKWLIILLSIFLVYEQYISDNYHRRSYKIEMKVQNALENLNIPKSCKYLDIKYIQKDNQTPDIVYQEEIDRIRVMWFAGTHNSYFISGYSGLTESDDNFENPYRKKIQNDPQYCVIIKNLKYSDLDYE
jgi:hypothetical protein